MRPRDGLAKLTKLTRHGKMNCIIVDDNQEFLVSAARLLELEGVRVVGCATTGAEALRLLDSVSPPDVVLVDIELGEENGIELAQVLAERLPGTPVILISSHDRDELEELMPGTGAVGFVPKQVLGAKTIAELIR